MGVKHLNLNFDRRIIQVFALSRFLRRLASQKLLPGHKFSPVKPVTAKCYFGPYSTANGFIGVLFAAAARLRVRVGQRAPRNTHHLDQLARVADFRVFFLSEENVGFAVC
jgi:hypothetical protein